MDTLAKVLTLAESDFKALTNLAVTRAKEADDAASKALQIMEGLRVTYFLSEDDETLLHALTEVKQATARAFAAATDTDSHAALKFW